MTYTWIACEFTTGDVLCEVPITGWSAQRHIKGGQATGQLVLQNLNADRRRELLAFTAPGRCTLVLDRDGRCMGEWLILKRGRTADSQPIPLVAQEIISYLSFQQVPAGQFGDPNDDNDPGVEQLGIAAWLARAGFDGQGGKGVVSVSVPKPVPSGQLRRRTYVAYEATVGQRLEELSQVINGFEYVVDSVWDLSSSPQRVARTFRLGYPQVGNDAGLVFDDQGNSIQSLAFDEDATLLGTRAVALCSGDDAGQIVGVVTSDVLLDQGYPALDVTHSWTSVNKQSTADKHAQALLASSGSPEVPPTVSVLANGDPALGDYGLGDTVRLSVGARTNLPDGYDERVRILGWTLTPGRPESVALEVTTVGVDQ